MRHRKQRRYATTLPDITLTPLIDTVLVLLIIFMIAMPVLQTYIPLELPRAQHGQTVQEESPVCVYVDANAQCYVDNQPVASQDMYEHIGQVIGRHGCKGVVVYADKHVSYGTVISLLDCLQKIETASYVTLAAEYTDEA